MPRIIGYPETTPSSAQSQPIHQDDSVILSDLLRAGESSRLRRRGAVRGSVAGYPHAQTPTWDFDVAPSAFPPFGGPHRRHTRRYPHMHPSDKSLHAISSKAYVYTLTCGVEQSTIGSDEFSEPWKPSILPLYPPSPSAESSRIPLTRSTGCGNVIHFRAAPRPLKEGERGMWAARSAASEVVVPLEADYFETQHAALFVQNPCGCVTEGVGCAICGNALGIRHIPCPVAREGLLCGNKPGSGSRRDSLPHPTSFSYASAQSHDDFSSYSFFSSSVTSSPAYEFSPTPSSTTTGPDLEDDEQCFTFHANDSSSVWEREFVFSERTQGPWQPPFDSPSSEAILGDETRFRTASPLPLSDLDSDDETVGRGPLWSRDPLSSSLRREPLSSGSFGYDEAGEEFYQRQIMSAWERERNRSRRRGDGVGFGWAADDDDELRAGSFPWRSSSFHER